ncbi:MAG: histidine--tRNA ligase [Erysipelotrichaceae bacterium]
MSENYQMPRGTQDIFGTEIDKWHIIESLAKDMCYLYNYEEIRTPVFEHTEVFARKNDSSDVVNKEMYTFTDNGGRSLTLRPEGTAGIIRSFVEHKMYGNADLPTKFYYIAPNFRYERPQKGRMRIHHQFGCEVIGAKSPIIDCEVITLGISVVKALGLKDIKVLINTLGDFESREAYKVALKAHFEQHIDTMCEDCKRRLIQNPLRILDCKIDADHQAMANAPKLTDYLNDESKAYFNQVLMTLEALGIEYEVNEKLVRGLDYYSHTVFEVVSVNGNMGSQSTLFGGGRYDNFVSYYGGPELSGIGFGMGIERLLVALEAENIILEEEKELDVYIMCLDPNNQTKALALATKVRAMGFSCDMDYQLRSFKAQFKSVDRQKAKVVFIMGEDEFANNEITLKHIASQTQIKIKEEEMLETLDELIVTGDDHHE